MAETMSWRTLKLDEEWGVPRLLTKTTFSKNGYEIQLTDLSRIWGEKLGKETIVKRASKDGCSIDPSEDDQYDILLEKIESALKGDPGTTLELQSHYDPEAQLITDNLRLSVTAPLPGSLPTFEWSFQLGRLPHTAVGVELVTPLVAQTVLLRKQIQHLIDELASKDRVITKITDRLEASGNDLTAVFPGAFGIKISRKRSQRGQLASHVKGLADFDESAWRKLMNQHDHDVDLSAEILNGVLEHLPVAKSRAELGSWWVDLPPDGASGEQPPAGTTHKLTQSSTSETSERHETTTNGHPSLSTEQSAGEDEFQRQGTPPQLKKTTESALDEDEETDDDDLDAVQSKASSSQTKGRSQQHDETVTSTKPASAPRKLGVLGGKKAKSPEPELPQVPQAEAEAETEDDEPPAPKPKPKGKLGAFGGKKAASPQPAHSPEPEPELEKQSPRKTKSKLGTFGGASRAAVASVEPADTEEHDNRSKPKLGTFGGGKGSRSSVAAPVKEEAREDEVPPSPVKGKLGRMGGRGGSKKEEPKAADIEAEAERQARAAEEKEEQQRQEREDSQERADKKRERLKRELEEKAKGPVKKKRKF